MIEANTILKCKVLEKGNAQMYTYREKRKRRKGVWFHTPGNNHKHLQGWDSSLFSPLGYIYMIICEFDVHSETEERQCCQNNSEHRAMNR